MSLRNLPLAWQMAMLTAASVLVGCLVMVAINLLGPPPRDPPTRVAEVIRALDPAAGSSRRLLRDVTVAAPDPAGLVADSALAQRVVRDTGVPALAVQAWGSGEYRSRRDEIFGEFLVAQRLPDGRWLTVRKARDRSLAKWLAVTGLTVALLLAAFGLLGLYAARRIIQPVAALARAARMSRTGAPITLPPMGKAPPEVREAAEALGDLYHRTLDHGRQQVTMLAAIAHDVGTPVARLAFRADDLPDEHREAAMQDIAIIRQMLADALNLSRHWNEGAERVDMAALCRRLVDAEAATGADIALEAGADALVAGNPTALYRMVQNLVDNALRYGGSARLALRREGHFVLLEVSDSGPGFPDIPAQDLLQPFVRGDASRNAATGGSGLGLAIASQVARQAGGTITLGAAPGGGARVLVALPHAG